MNAGPESLIVLSDVHLGSDLNDSGPRVPRSTAIDRDLTELLDHYAATAPPAGRWRLILAGDFIDFVGMAIDPRDRDELRTPPTAVDRKLGLGGAEDHSRLKLARTRERHPEVFLALERFVAGGHAVTFVLGNHDLELHWPGVKEDLVELLAGGDAAAASRIDFSAWFFHRKGLVWIEHGHQFDPFCATPFLLEPMSPHEPERVLPSLSDSLLRYVVRRTPGMKEYGHEDRGLASYIGWGLMLGGRGMIALFWRFFEVVGVLRRTARAWSSAAGTRIAAAHDRGLDALAAASGHSRALLESALALHVAPLGVSSRGVLASVMLDRLLMLLVAVPTLLVLVALRGRLGGPVDIAIGVFLLLMVIAHFVLARGRPTVDPRKLMSARAADLARLFPSAFVVMGHTHIPESMPAGDATYVNLGSWAEEEPDPGDTKPYRAARTHLVIHVPEGARPEAQLCEWCSGEGPRPRLTLGAGGGAR